MNDSKDFQDAESIRSGNSHVANPPGLFPKHPPFEGLLKPAFISQRQTEEPPNIWDTSGVSGNVFAHPQTSSSAPYPQELNSTWKKTIEEPTHMSTAEKSGGPERDQDLRVMADFGQTDFGQPSLASANWWPTLANPTLASVSVLVVWPTLAKPTSTCVCVCLCVFMCVCVCVCWFHGFGTVLPG